jgi:arabinogalactan oligomer/maltooligosaccharide transport system permease protein
MVASTSAYAFSRWNFPGRNPSLIFLLATQMIPGSMLMIPIYVIAARTGLINTWRGLVIAYSVSAVPFSIWILKGYYDSIPMELEQSAMVDGATRMQAFFRIILPLSTPALAIAFLFNFTQAWNDFLLARIMLQQTELYTWPLGLQSMQRQFMTQWGEFSAAALMVSVPVMIMFLTSSRWLISGLTVGSVKG